MTLGRYPRTSLAEAFKEYSLAADKVEQGEDPAADKVQENINERGVPTVEEMASDYIEYAKLNKRSWREDKRQLDKDIVPELGPKTKINAVKKSDIKAILDTIAKRGALVQANRTLALLRRFFDFAMDELDEGIVEVSPCYRVKPKVKEVPRERSLALDEVRCIWGNLERLNVEKKTICALRLLLLTLQRESEVVGIHKSELNVNAGTWIIPGERTKNKRPHLVPLSPPVIAIIAEMEDEAPGSEFLFPGQGKAKHMSKRPLQRAVADNLDILGVAKFTPHDLRRTGSTQLGAFKVPRFDRERVLNHTDRTVGAVYDRYGYEDEKRAALNLWADIVQECAKSKKQVNEKKLRQQFRYRDYFED